MMRSKAGGLLLAGLLFVCPGILRAQVPGLMN